MSGNESVFSLVLIAWSALASAFGPLMIVYALDEHPSETLAIAMTIAGVATVIAWRAAGLDATVVYEVMPGMLAGLLAFAAGKIAGMAPAPRMSP